MAQRKITQLKGVGIPVAAVGGAGASSGSPVPGGGGGGGGADDAAQAMQLLQKRTAELDEREEALIKADRLGVFLRMGSGCSKKGCGRRRTFCLLSMYYLAMSEALLQPFGKEKSSPTTAGIEPATYRFEVCRSIR